MKKILLIFYISINQVDLDPGRSLFKAFEIELMLKILNYILKITLFREAISQLKVGNKRHTRI